jgi:hypothetical protein
MKREFLYVSAALFLVGCASQAPKEAEQTPRFGQPESTIPWNKPTDWEQGGQLGSMPGFQPSR